MKIKTLRCVFLAINKFQSHEKINRNRFGIDNNCCHILQQRSRLPDKFLCKR